MSLHEETNPYWWVVAENLKATDEFAENTPENPAIQDIYAVCGAPISYDETTWSAAVVGACLELSGFHSTNALTAMSYKNFGKPLQIPVKGCIALFKSTAIDQANTGYVAFFSHIGDDGKIYCLGGNQFKTINITGYNRSLLRGYYWPTKVGSLPEPRPRHLFTIDNLTHDVPPHLLDIFPDHSPLSPKESLWHGETGGFNDCLSHIMVMDESKINHETYRLKFWDVNASDSLPKPLAFLTFNTSIIFGAHRSAEILQQTLNMQGSRLVIDGDIGVKTIAASQRVNMQQAVHDYIELYRARIKTHYTPSMITNALNRLIKVEIIAQNFTKECNDIEQLETKIAPLVEQSTPMEETMSNQITLSQDELSNIIESAVKEAVKKSTPVVVPPTIIEEPKTLTIDDVRALIAENAQKPVIINEPTAQILKITSTPTIITAIDRVLGGKMLAGKKTLIAVAIIMINTILTKKGIITGDIADIITILAAGLGAAGLLSKLDRATEK